jgi:hypothetical protein
MTVLATSLSFWSLYQYTFPSTNPALRDHAHQRFKWVATEQRTKYSGTSVSGLLCQEATPLVLLRTPTFSPKLVISTMNYFDLCNQDTSQLKDSSLQSQGYLERFHCTKSLLMTLFSWDWAGMSVGRHIFQRWSSVTGVESTHVSIRGRISPQHPQQLLACCGCPALNLELCLALGALGPVFLYFPLPRQKLPQHTKREAYSIVFVMKLNLQWWITKGRRKLLHGERHVSRRSTETDNRY